MAASQRQQAWTVRCGRRRRRNRRRHLSWWWRWRHRDGGRRGRLGVVAGRGGTDDDICSGGGGGGIEMADEDDIPPALPTPAEMLNKHQKEVPMVIRCPAREGTHVRPTSPAMQKLYMNEIFASFTVESSASDRQYLLHVPFTLGICLLR